MILLFNRSIFVFFYCAGVSDEEEEEQEEEEEEVVMSEDAIISLKSEEKCRNPFMPTAMPHAGADGHTASGRTSGGGRGEGGVGFAGANGDMSGGGGGGGGGGPVVGGEDGGHLDFSEADEESIASGNDSQTSKLTDMASSKKSVPWAFKRYL